MITDEQMEQEPLLVQQAFYTAWGTVKTGNVELIKELSELLARHATKGILIINEQQN